MTADRLRHAIAHNHFATLSGTAGTLYTHLLVLLDTGPKRLTIVQLAELCHISEKSARRAIARLQARDLVTVTPMHREHRHRYDGTYALGQLVRD